MGIFNKLQNSMAVLEVKWRDKTSKKTGGEESEMSELDLVGLADLASRPEPWSQAR